MKYTLCENVYIVNGAARSCIYDFNNNRLFSINASLAKELSRIKISGIDTELIDAELRKAVNEMANMGILRESEEIWNRDISEITRGDHSLRFAWIEITQKCNLKCIHCYNESDDNQAMLMNLTDYKMVVDLLYKLKISKIQVIGGEPFLFSKQLKVMLDYTIGKFDFIEIFTNGTLLDDEWFEYLRVNEIALALSVYSYEAAVHDKVTGMKGSHQKTNDTIQKLKDNHIKYRVCNVLMADVPIGDNNTDLYELSSEKDVVRMTGRANWELLSDELIRKRLITKKTFSKPINKDFCGKTITGHNCFMDKVYVAANLDVYPCVMERRIKHCNIKCLGDLVLNEDIRYMNKDHIEGCQNCEYRYACYDCRPNTLSENVMAKPWYCTYLPEKGEWLDENFFIKMLYEDNKN